MEPSCPRLLFWGIFKITDSIYLQVISQFIFSISSWFSLWRLYLFQNLFISSRWEIYLWLLAHCSLLWPFVFLWCQLYNNFFLIFDFIDLGPLSFLLMSLSKGLSVLSFQKISFQFHWSFLFFSMIFSLFHLFALIFMISFLIWTLVFVCSSFFFTP